MPKERATLLLTDSLLRQLVQPADANEVVERALAALGAGRAVAPHKLLLDLGADGRWPDLGGVAFAMPAYVESPTPTAGLKWVSSFAANPGRGLPTVSGLILLVDPNTGRLCALLDAEYLTGLRVGASTVAGVRALGPAPRRTAILGAGVQARYQALCLAAAFPDLQLRVYARRAEAAGAFADVLAARTSRPVAATTDPAEAASDCELVVASTSASTPFLEAAALASARLVVSVGGGEELADDVVEWAERIVVDQVESMLVRGSLAPKLRRGTLDPARLGLELAQAVAAGPADPAEARRTLLIHLGVAVGDLALAQLACERAREAGLGQEIDLSS